MNRLLAYTARDVRVFRHSPAFECLLLKNGKPIASVTNSGNGGCHRVSGFHGGPSVRAARDAYATLEDIAREVLSDDFEAADSIVCALVDLHANGQRTATGADAAVLWLDYEAERLGVSS